MEEHKIPNKNKPEVTGSGKVVKNSTSKRFAEVFLAEDVADAKSYIFWDVAVPIIKNGISSVFHSTIDAIFGPAQGGSYGRTPQGGNRTNYNRYSWSENSRNNRIESTERRRVSYAFDDIKYDNVSLPNRILDDLNDIIDEYGLCSINDYYDVVRQYIQGIILDSSFEDSKYGWTSLRGTTVERCMGGGYMIRFPKARPLD